MYLNQLAPDLGSRHARKRLGRGVGSGLGKTSGKGHKGQKARAGGFHKINFEGGQMPIQRRLPKMGFKSRTAKTCAEVNLNELALINADVIDLNALKAANIIGHAIVNVKVILSGELTSTVKLKGLRVTKGAKKVIEDLGGCIEA